MTPRPHISVLMKETLDALRLAPGENVIDCTVGAGGHSAAMLDATSPDGKLLGFDLDEAALDSARSTLAPYGSRAMLVRESYRDVRKVLTDTGFGPVHAALLDLGFSSMEIDDPTRGFSFRFDGPLDMRFDQRAEQSAATIVNMWPLNDLAAILWEYGEERWARKIAEGIVKARRQERILTTFQLVDVIAHSVPSFYRRGKIHFATRTFQALRIATNDELDGLSAALPDLLDSLAPGGRLAVISFHSLEDRIVKRFFRAQEDAGLVTLHSKRPIGPSEEEEKENSRSRSAKLRVAIKSA